MQLAESPSQFTRTDMRIARLLAFSFILRWLGGILLN